jgi:hypothetical protein
MAKEKNRFFLSIFLILWMCVGFSSGERGREREENPFSGGTCERWRRKIPEPLFEL